MLKEFRDFAVKGNMIDMAVGIIIGAGFGKLVNSFVNDLMMPPLGLLVGKVNFSNLFVTLGEGQYLTLEQAKAAGAPTINFGIFINAMIDFTLVAFAVFLLVKQVNRMKKQAPAADPTTKDCPICCTNIPIKAQRCPHCTSELKLAA